MSKNDFLKVYVSALPSQYEGKALYPKERQNYIDNIKNSNLTTKIKTNNQTLKEKLKFNYLSLSNQLDI